MSEFSCLVVEDSPMMRQLLVFAREPVAGRVKTRLIPTLGEAAATALYRRMLYDTLTVAAQVTADRAELWVDRLDTASELRVRARDLGMLTDDGLDEHQQSMLKDKRAQFEEQIRATEPDRVTADGPVAAALHIAAGNEVLHVKLVHYESGVPIQLEDRYVVPSFAPELLKQDFMTTTPSAYLSSIAPLQEAEHVVRAELPDDAVSESLDLDASEACLVVSRRTWARGRPATYARLYHPGNRFELSGHYVPPGTRPGAGSGV